MDLTNVVKMLGLLLQFLRSSMLVVLKRFFCWLVDKFLGWGEAFLDIVFPLLPDAAVGYMVAFGSWLFTASAYFPVGAAISAISAIMTVYIVCMAIRIIRRFLPF